MDTIIDLGKVTEETKGAGSPYFERIDDDECDDVLRQSTPAGCG
jgi:hypothetical protein